MASVLEDQADQVLRHPGHMGGDTLECRVGCLVNQFYIMILPVSKNLETEKT